MNTCKKCNSEIDGNFCSNCGQPTSLKRIDGRYLLSEIGSVLNFQKGIFFTIKELLIKPGQNIREFIAEDRNRLVKPIMFIIISSLIYTISTRLFHFEDGYVTASYDSDTVLEMLFGWIQNNYGYANLIMGVIISVWVQIFFRKYGYNLVEILILLCFVMGIYMLLFSLFGILGEITKLKLGQLGGIVGVIYSSWAIAQFFDKTKKMNYLKAFLSYFLGMLTSILLVVGLGFLIDFIC